MDAMEYGGIVKITVKEYHNDSSQMQRKVSLEKLRLHSFMKGQEKGDVSEDLTKLVEQVNLIPP